MIILFHAIYLLGEYAFNKYFSRKFSFDNHEEIFIRSYDISPIASDEEEDFDFVTNNSDIEPNSIEILRHQMMMRNNLRNSGSEDEVENSKSNIKFSPPAFIQRYMAVQNVLQDKKYTGKIKKVWITITIIKKFVTKFVMLLYDTWVYLQVVEFGCADLNFFKYLKNTSEIEEILLVDIDRVLLEMCKHKIKPLHADYLFTRKVPLQVKLIEGSVTHSDKSLINCDAVILIEL